MFERKVRRKHNREALENCSTHLDSGLTRKNKTRLLRLLSNEENKFYNIDYRLSFFTNVPSK